jgi:hypothetical protein
VTKDARYGRSAKGKARRLRYDRSAKGQAVIARRNAKRVFGASGFLGYAPRPEQAEQLNEQVRRYRDRQKQSGAQGRGRAEG